MCYIKRHINGNLALQDDVHKHQQSRKAETCGDSKINILFKNDVIQLGTTPYLFLHQKNRAQRQYDLFTRQIEIKPTNIVNFKDNIDYNCDLSANCLGAKYLHVVFPAKIPTFAELFSRFGINVTSCFYDYNFENPCVLYPQNLVNNDFYVQDTHNSDLGKIKIVDQCLSYFGISPINSAKKWGKLPLVGDLGKKIGRPPCEEAKFLGFDDIIVTSETNSNRQALNGNTGELSWTINNFVNAAQRNRKLALFGDSFAKACVKYLSFYFDEIIYVRSPFIMKDIAAQFQPTHIMTSNAERYLSSVPHWSKGGDEFLTTVRAAIDKLENKRSNEKLKWLVEVKS